MHAMDTTKIMIVQFGVKHGESCIYRKIFVTEGTIRCTVRVKIFMHGVFHFVARCRGSRRLSVDLRRKWLAFRTLSRKVNAEEFSKSFENGNKMVRWRTVPF